jgi:hypothetical protein
MLCYLGQSNHHLRNQSVTMPSWPFRANTPTGQG